MELDKTLQFDAPPAAVWALLLDPVAMGACVPGMQSIQVISEDEYIAQMQVKISFISANFKLRTRIVERDEPNYLRAEGTGEDTKVASSLKQSSEMWLAARADGGTELRMKVKADVLGRMGAFGLNVMKTKADRLWDEFGVNAAARLAAPAVDVPAVPLPAELAAAVSSVTAASVAVTTEPATVPASAAATPARATPAPLTAAPGMASPASLPVTPATVAATTASATASAATAPQTATADRRDVKRPAPPVAPMGIAAPASRPGFWARLFGAPPASSDIRIEVQRGDTLIRVQWPVQAAAECTAWLRSLELGAPPPR